MRKKVLEQKVKEVQRQTKLLEENYNAVVGRMGKRNDVENNKMNIKGRKRGKKGKSDGGGAKSSSRGVGSGQ
eukprot:4391955-Ditylum_brightwellii.AAC.1